MAHIPASIMAKAVALRIPAVSSFDDGQSANSDSIQAEWQPVHNLRALIMAAWGWNGQPNTVPNCALKSMRAA